MLREIRKGEVAGEEPEESACGFCVCVCVCVWDWEKRLCDCDLSSATPPLQKTPKYAADKILTSCCVSSTIIAAANEDRCSSVSNGKNISEEQSTRTQMWCAPVWRNLGSSSACGVRLGVAPAEVVEVVAPSSFGESGDPWREGSAIRVPAGSSLIHAGRSVVFKNGVTSIEGVQRRWIFGLLIPLERGNFKQRVDWLKA